MRILILGATGRVGRVMTELALRDGHEVTVLVRDADKVEKHDRLNIIEGDACREADIERAMTGCEAVISALNTDGTTTLSDSIPLIIIQMQRVGIRRIVTIGTAGILQSREEPQRLRYESNESRRRSTRAAEEHRRVYERLSATDLEWTIVCPTYLPDGIYTGQYRVERDYLPEGGKEISVADTAEFAYQQLVDRTYVGARVGIAY
ncbi:hypothetical protein B9G55_10855 [Saccharibacillus sp. O16]|nr:hypothetical protein B9G55_10855 [Saccharibacillus sp. O16]